MRIPLAVTLALCAVLPAQAAAATVSGNLAKGRGYTVIAMTKAGTSTKANVKPSGRFSLKPPGRGATLQLVNRGGVYFGPVVLRKAKGGKALLGLSTKSGKLGKLRLKQGFALARAPKRLVAAGPAVKTRRKSGAPLGAGRLGLVKVGAKARTAAAGADPGADTDGDGIPSTFDADDNGNKTFDAVDPATARGGGSGLFTDVEVMMARSANVNAGGLDRAGVDRFVQGNTSLNFYVDPTFAGGATISSVDVDCGVLTYCRPGDGTALLGDGGNSPTGVQDQPWITLDENNDGFPDIPVAGNGGPGGPGGPGGKAYSVEIRPNATTADLHAGDLYNLRLATSSGVVTVPTAPSLFFVSSPALASYDGGAGSQTSTYPAGDSSAGSDQNPLRMSGDSLTTTFWRPQRFGLGGEPEYVDMGLLRYGLAVAAGGRQISCDAGYYSGLSSTLRPTGGTASYPLRDSASDATPSAANMLQTTLDLGGCLRANGVASTGQQIRVQLQAAGEATTGGSDRTAQNIAVCLPGCTPGTGGPGGP